MKWEHVREKGKSATLTEKKSPSPNKEKKKKNKQIGLDKGHSPIGKCRTKSKSTTTTLFWAVSFLLFFKSLGDFVFINLLLLLLFLFI